MTDQDTRETDLNQGRIAEIWRYPVKSMLGERLTEGEITERGLVGDRAFALLDPETGKVVSAKNPRRWPNLFEFRASYQPESDRARPVARITLPDGSILATTEPDAETRLSDAAGRSVRLAQSADSTPGAQGEGYWPDHDWLADRDQTFEFELAPGTFFDGAMLHLLTKTTLETLQSTTPASRFDIRRFRPSLVIESPDGAAGFVEDAWIGRNLAIGEALIKVDGPCPRCVMTTLPQQDLPKDPAILRTAVRLNGGNVGVYASVLRGGRVRQGDQVRLA
ncbi:MAG: hypothetical protein ABS79_02425 [Planctomycetes bacterium SCN 63-9]|nr:MAG: hypothetical protein ABS79_02425 [Planctomycetes bacterium SCN 63-9]